MIFIPRDNNPYSYDFEGIFFSKLVLFQTTPLSTKNSVCIIYFIHRLLLNLRHFLSNLYYFIICYYYLKIEFHFTGNKFFNSTNFDILNYLYPFTCYFHLFISFLYFYTISHGLHYIHHLHYHYCLFHYLLIVE